MDIEHVWAEFHVGLKAFLNSRVANADDVDDLLQEILLKAHRNIHTLQAEEKLKPWIYQIAANAITDFYRRRANSQSLQTEDLWYTPENKTALNDLEQCLEPLISALPDEYSALLTAIDLQGQSQKEYAEQKAIHYSTLKSRVQKGRNMLRDLFEDCCHFSVDKFGNVMHYEEKKHCDRC